MQKTKLALLVFLVILGFSGTMLSTKADSVKKPVKTVKEVSIQKAEYTQFEDFFTPAFQLIWNDFSDKFVKGSIEFVDGNPAIVNNLNKKRVNDSMFSSKDLYKTIGLQTVKTKKRIERDLKRKFKETSKLLDAIQWYNKTDDKYVLYAMFKKDVLFLNAFKDLSPASFANSKDKYKYFGITRNTEAYAKEITPIYYNSKNDFAVKLATKNGDEIILLTDNSNKPVFEIWDNFYTNKLSKKSDLTFDEDSKLLVPQIDFKNRINYKELTNRKIKGSKYVIDTALEDIEFSLDKNGAKIRNEAIMSVKRMALRPDSLQKIYNFNKPFILFIRSKDDKVPYFALKIKDTKYLVKE